MPAKTLNQQITSLRRWLSLGNRANWLIFLLFALFTFGKTLIFNAYAFRYNAEPNVFNLSFVGLGSMLMKMAMAVLCASVTFLLKDKRWLILLSIIIDTWCIANLIYMRNNYILLDAEAFNQSGNLHGYWKSTLIYIEWGIDLLFYGLTLLYSSVYFLTTRSRRSGSRCLYVIIAGIILHVIGESCYNHQTPLDTSIYNPINRANREQVYGTKFSRQVEETSVLESPIYIAADYARLRMQGQPQRPFNDADLDRLMPISAGNPEIRTKQPLIIILLESLENWVVREDVMPNLYRLTQNEHVLYADHINTQIIGAPSADGQMIVNTGILPLSAGATCLHYSKNIYPSLMNIADGRPVCLLPHDTCVWNQTEMSPAYGYDTTIIYSDIDTLLFAKLNSLIDEGEQYIQCITQSTHAPFANQVYSSLTMPKDMPWVMSSYIKGFNALDDALGIFIRKLEADPALQQYTVVITGDHRILHREKREQMARYCKKHGMDYTAQYDYLPLVIYSPQIKQNRHVTSETYQMDIYPTVLSLIGAKDYDWKGFGADLMDDEAIENREFTADEAAYLSDKMLRNDYFRRYSRWNE